MTKKDYKLIAKALWQAGFIEDKNKIRHEAKREMRLSVVAHLVGVLKGDNERFDADKFMEACGR